MIHPHLMLFAKGERKDMSTFKETIFLRHTVVLVDVELEIQRQPFCLPK